MANKSLIDFDFFAPAPAAGTAPAAPKPTSSAPQRDPFADFDLSSPVAQTAPAPARAPAPVPAATPAPTVTANAAPAPNKILATFSKLIPNLSNSSSSTAAAPVTPSLVSLPTVTAQPSAPRPAAPSSSSSSSSLPDAPLDATWLVMNHPEFECRVGNPLKLSTGLLNSEWSFEVTTKTRWPQFGASQLAVRRSFADFEWLANVLEQLYSHLLVPPLLGKTKLLATQTDDEWAASACRFVTKFLMDLAHHSVVLTHAPAFCAFLSASDDTFASAKKEAATAVAAANSARLTLKERAKQVLTGLPGTIAALAASATPAPAPVVSPADQELLQVVNGALQDAKQLADVLRQLCETVREQHRALAVFAARSAQNAPLAKALATSVVPDVEARLTQHTGVLSATLAADSASTAVHARRLALSALEPLEFWRAKAAQLESLCDRLHEVRRVCETLKQAQVRAITTATASNAASHRASLESLHQRITDAEASESLHRSTIAAEIAAFNEQRVREFKRLIYILGVHQTTAHRELATVWFSSLSKMS